MLGKYGEVGCHGRVDTNSRQSCRCEDHHPHYVAPSLHVLVPVLMVGEAGLLVLVVREGPRGCESSILPQVWVLSS